MVDQKTKAKWTEEQNRLRKQLVESDMFDWQADNPKRPGFLKYVSLHFFRSEGGRPRCELFEDQ